MVSTRQMSTSGGSTISVAGTSAVNNGGNFAVEDVSPRLSVVARNSHMSQMFKASGSQPQLQFQVDHPNVTSLDQEVNAGVSRDIGATHLSSPIRPQLHFLDLPTEILMKIFSYTDYKKVSQCRLVSTKLNSVCMLILNSTFSKLITKTYNRFHVIKANMPRRESARRNHPLACECDIIETCYMRLSLLQMTLGKHIERGHCCFFPGAILDEVYAILKYISITPRLQRPFRVTDELFDLSTMAMEYFRDRIESTLPGIAYFSKEFFKLPSTAKRPPLVISSDNVDNATNSPPQNHMVLRKGIRKIKQGMKIYNNQLSVLRSELRTCKRKSVDQGKQIAEQQKLLAEQQKQTLEYANRLDENDKKNEEMSRKFSTLLQELNKCKTELQFWRSKSPAVPICASCNQKVTPSLPPEDFQALVNQGVDPEDIVININDDTESDLNVSETQISESVEIDFALPDEATTAKMLALNVAVKNLKRKCQTVPGLNGNGSIDGDDKTEGATSGCSLSGFYNLCDDDTDDNVGASTSKAAQFNRDGYSTKSFYANQIQQHQRGGVIVSPVSMLKRPIEVSDNTMCNDSSTVLFNSNDSTLVSRRQYTNVCNGADVVGFAIGVNTSDNEQVLQETKKARRVQKATRCINSNGKRSK